jgi:hypothetical protein
MAAGDPPRRRTRRMLLSFLWPLGIRDRETAQAESVTTAAVRGEPAPPELCNQRGVQTSEDFHERGRPHPPRPRFSASPVVFAGRRHF